MQSTLNKLWVSFAFTMHHLPSLVRYTNSNKRESFHSVFKHQQVSHIDFVSRQLGLLFRWEWPVSAMVVEPPRISWRENDKGKVMVNKRLLIRVPRVIRSGNIKVILLLGRSDQGNILVCPLLSSVFVMPTWPRLVSPGKRLRPSSPSFCQYVYFSLRLCGCINLKWGKQLGSN